MKAKPMIVMILFLVLSLALSNIVSAEITQITTNTHEDSFPHTAGGIVVWQARINGDWEIYLYNAKDKTGPLNISNNEAFNDTSPKTDGNYVIWTADTGLYGKIFIYDIAQGTATQLTDFAFTANPVLSNGKVAWIYKPVEYIGLGIGIIYLYDIATGNLTNVSELVPWENTGYHYEDYGFRFDGQQIFWNRQNVQLESVVSYLYDLATGNTYRYYSPVDDEEFVPFLSLDLVAGSTKDIEGNLILQDNPQVDGDILVFTRIVGGDREIFLRDKKNKRGGPLTDNDIEDTQPSIADDILVWKGDMQDAAEIYIYEIPPILTLVSPADGSEFTIKEFPVFGWDSSFIKFKIQFSVVASFEEQYTRTFPESNDAWLSELSITLDKKQVNEIKGMLGDYDNPNFLYWRVLAQDGAGNVEITETRHLVLTK
ncbi:hypothetical protein ACFLZ5_00805 [Thermodesulfobacteriota bacterium]